MHLKHLKIYFCLSLLLTALACSTEELPVLNSPNRELELQVTLNETGSPVYQLSRQEEILLQGDFGVVMEDQDFSKDLELAHVGYTRRFKENYELHHGKRRKVSYEGNEKEIVYTNTQGNEMSLSLRLSNEGLAFRYTFKGEGEGQIIEEKTSYHFDEQTIAWLQPMARVNTGWEGTNPSYEEEYQMAVPVGTPSPVGVGWVYPALFKTGENWVLITEAGLEANYCGTRLDSESGNGRYQVMFPDPEERIPGGAVRPNATFPWETPWRVLAVGDLKTVMESNLGTSLATPEKPLADSSFIQPGQASWSWALGKDESITDDIQVAYIDYAAEMGWQHCLVDVDWDTRIGYERMGELAAYATERGVMLHAWYNSAGSWNTAPYHPRDRMLTREGRLAEFEKIKALGIAGVKIDFFAGDGQSVIAYYHEILEDAGKIGLMVNFHGTTLPRGWHRTYPHLMTMESVKGFEMISFAQDFADRAVPHMLMQPFTRNVYDPMDFTPMVLDEIPNIERRSSEAFELALSVVYQSGIQHYAERPEGMAKQPEAVKEFLRDLPASWEDYAFVEGYPAEYVVLARKGPEGWYLAGITASEERTLSLDWSQWGGEEALLFIDGENGIESRVLKGKSLDLVLRANQGFVIQL